MMWYDARKDTLESIMADRSQWLKVTATENEHGSYDVSLRLDGSYADKAAAEGQADFFRKELEPFLSGMRLVDWSA